VGERELVEAAALASQGDATPEGRSILRFAERRGVLPDPARVEAALPFVAAARMSGARLRDGGEVRKGAVDAVLAWAGVAAPPELAGIVARIAGTGGTPLAVARDRRPLGVVHLKDTIDPDLRERFAQLRRMGVRSVMVTGDNPLTAAAIAAEAGVDDFVAQAPPVAKLELIRAEQAKGRPVAMCGDGTNDAPALAQADVGVAMARGTVAAREAGNMLDLASDPLKLVEVIRACRRLRLTQGALAAFALAGDGATFLVLVPAVLAAGHPWLAALATVPLASPARAALAALVCKALAVAGLIPLALRGARRWPVTPGAARATRLAYGVAGVAAPVAGIAVVDRLLAAIGVA
jgi:K+-transporting ATPase ATPase B chain